MKKISNITWLFCRFLDRCTWRKWEFTFNFFSLNKWHFVEQGQYVPTMRTQVSPHKFQDAIAFDSLLDHPSSSTKWVQLWWFLLLQDLYHDEASTVVPTASRDFLRTGFLTLLVNEGGSSNDDDDSVVIEMVLWGDAGKEAVAIEYTSSSFSGDRSVSSSILHKSSVDKRKYSETSSEAFFTERSPSCCGRKDNKGESRDIRRIGETRLFKLGMVVGGTLALRLRELLVSRGLEANTGELSQRHGRGGGILTTLWLLALSSMMSTSEAPESRSYRRMLFVSIIIACVDSFDVLVFGMCVCALLANEMNSDYSRDTNRCEKYNRW